MAPIPCTAPNCTTTFNETLDPTVLLALIQMHDRTAHQADARPQQPSKPEKVKRPSIASSGTSEEFTYFQQRWQGYKAATKLQGRDIIFQLLECCDEPLRKDLTRTYGDLTEKDEDSVIDFIKTLAVRPENHLVARVQLLQLRQDRDEPIRSFCARLKGQASVCSFTKKCPCDNPRDVDYSDEMIRDCLIRNIIDEDIKLDVLGQVNQNITLDETLQLIEAKESGKRSANRLHESTGCTATAAMSSGYKKQQAQPRVFTQQYDTNRQNSSKPPLRSPKPCTHCGRTGHGSFLADRVKKCPAYNKQCSKCGIHHHHHSVCRSQRSSQPSQHGAMYDGQLHVYNSLCTSIHDDHVNQSNDIILDHHVYENLCNTWEKRRSEPQPEISVSINIHSSDALDLNLPTINKATPTVNFRAFTDTCCQSSLSGLDLLSKLQLNTTDLYPVRMSMTAANNKSIKILGALPLRITGISPSGVPHTTRQLVYFTDNTDKLFLSKQACTELKIIP